MDVSLDSFVAGKWYLAAEHIALSNHLLSVHPLLGSKKTIEALPVPLQKIVREEGRSTDLYTRTLAASDRSRRVLEEERRRVHQDSYAPFRKPRDPVYAGISSKIGGDLLERAIRAANG